MSSFLISFVSFVIVIGICVLVHEFGHFITSRCLGVQVHEFALGMGPVAKQIEGKDKKSGTRMLWSLRIFPIGGFCRIAGMGEDDEEGGEYVVKGMGFNEQPAWKRFFILLNGSLGNIVLALLLTTAFLCGYGVMNMDDTKIGTLMDDYPAQKAGFQAGDRILEVNGVRVSEWRGMSDTLREAAEDGDVTFTVERGGDTPATLTITTAIPMSESYGYPMLGITPALVKYSIPDGLKSSIGYTVNMTILMAKGIWDLVTGRPEVDVTGPVGIASMSGQAMREGAWSFITFLALISLNLGLLNLFPFPALDGGRIFFLFLETIFRRRMPEKLENWINAAGLVLLLCFMAFVTWKDIYNLFLAE